MSTAISAQDLSTEDLRRMLSERDDEGKRASSYDESIIV
jgi:hypothetical protein